MQLDLKVYLKRYSEMDKLFHDFLAIEERFIPLRDGRRWLTADDVTWLLDRDPFGKYWPTPHPKHLEQLSRKRLHFDLRSQDKRDVVKNLLGVVLDVGVASIILRFVNPYFFGVFSPPVHSVLLVDRMSTLDLYLAYCEELSEYKSHFNLSRVAEAEMALTALYEIMKGEYGKKESEAAQKAFKGDLWVQRRRAANVVRPFLRDFGQLQLARILLDDAASRLAGMIAAAEFERLLGLASREFRGQELTFESGAISELIDWLWRQRRISVSEKRSLQTVKNIRNAAVHGLGRQPAGKEVSWMIDEIERICSPWERGP